MTKALVSVFEKIYEIRRDFKVSGKYTAPIYIPQVNLIIDFNVSEKKLDIADRAGHRVMNVRDLSDVYGAIGSTLYAIKTEGGKPR